MIDDWVEIQKTDKISKIKMQNCGDSERRLKIKMEKVKLLRFGKKIKNENGKSKIVEPKPRE